MYIESNLVEPPVEMSHRSGRKGRLEGSALAVVCIRQWSAEALHNSAFIWYESKNDYFTPALEGLFLSFCDTSGVPWGASFIPRGLNLRF